jgi:hypothetical protein
MLRSTGLIEASIKKKTSPRDVTQWNSGDPRNDSSTYLKHPIQHPLWLQKMSWSQKCSISPIRDFPHIPIRKNTDFQIRRRIILYTPLKNEKEQISEQGN